jgi:hypothetical protein
MALAAYPHITIDGSSLGKSKADQYESEVKGTLHTMHLSSVGQLLIRAVPRSMKIVPYEKRDLNAYSKANDPRAAGVAGRAEYRCDHGMPITDVLNRPYLGTGGGSDTEVHFTPAQWFTDGIAHHKHKKILAAARRDEVLFHEMVHSLRQMNGLFNCSIGAPGFDTKEEVWSIMTTNIYCSAWNRPLRKDHSEHATMSAAEASTYFQRFDVMIGHMCRDLPVFTRAVAQISFIAFNPFRDWYAKNPTAQPYTH